MASANGSWFKRRGKRPEPMRALTAAGVRLDPADRRQARQQRAMRQGWQSDAWGYRDSIGELRYAVNFLSNCAARMRVYPAAYAGQGDENPVPLAEIQGVPPEVVAACEQAMAELGTGRLAVSALMASLSTNTTVAGECYFLGRQDPATGRESYSIRSIDEIVIENDRYRMREVPSDPQGVIPWIDLDPDSTVISRIWTPHPRFRLLADSPLRAILDDCEALLIKRREIRAQGRSRLAGAGMLLIPDEITIKAPVDDNDDPAADPFLGQLTNAMTAPISDEGVASAVVPLLLRGPMDALEKVRHITFASAIAKEDIQVRAELVGVIATGLDLPKEIIEGVADLNHWCLDTGTEILTERGWLTEADLEVGDRALSLNHETGLSEWQPITDIYRADVVDEPMLSIEHRLHSSLTTMAHRWPVLTRRGRDQHWEREWRTSDRFRTQDHIVTAAPSADVPTTAKYSDAFVETVAWLFTEGEIRRSEGRAPQVRLYQSHAANRENCDRIGAALTAAHGAPADGPMHRSTGQIPRWRRVTLDERRTCFSLNQAAAGPLIEKCPERVVDTAWLRELTRDQLDLFIDTAIRGDGTVNKRTGQRYFGQKDRARVEPVALAASLAGYSVTWAETEHEGFARHVQHGITISPRTMVGMQRGRRKVQSYTGRIFCPRVAVNGSFLARRRGSVYFTGNSAWQVDDNTFRHHVEPHVINCVDSLTDAYLRPYLEAAGVDPAWVARCALWYDPTELVTHPDQTQDAFQLHDRLAISDEALRKVAGFERQDAPSQEEFLVRLLHNMRQWPPNMVMAAVHALDPGLTIPPITEAGTVPGVKPGGVDTGVVAAVPTDQAAPTAMLPAGPVKPPAPPAGPSTTAPGPPAVTASGGVSHDRLSRKLMQIDRDLRTRLQTAANASMLRQLERAGARLRAKVAKDETLRSKIDQRPNERVAAILGPAAVTAASVTTQELMGGDWSGLQAQFHEWTQTAQKQAVAAAIQIGGLAPEDEAVKAAETAMAAGREEAWAVLQGALTNLGHQLLYDPDPNVTPGAWGDLNPDSLVPTGLIRVALAVAGGAPVAEPTDTLTEPFGQIGTGSTIGDLIRGAGLTTERYVWEHGPSLVPFPPHEDLDGVEFTSFDDEALANGDGFPDNAYFLPGDHENCSCDVTPMWTG